MSMTAWINHQLVRAADFLLAPLEGHSPWVALLASSALMALLALLSFKYTSNQKKLRRLKAHVLARSLEIQLFKDNLFDIFRAFGATVLGTGRYLLATLPPLLVMLPVMILMIIQLAGTEPALAGDGRRSKT